MQHLKDYFSQFNIRFSDTGYHRFINPFDTSRHRNMVVNFEINMVYDWKLGYSTTVAKFVSDHSGMPYQDAVDFVGLLDIPTLSGVRPVFNPESSSDVVMPLTTSLFENSVLGERARNYLIERKFDLNVLDDKGWTVGVEGKWLGRIIIPFKIKGKLVYYIGRTFLGEDPKYLNPISTDVGVGKSELLYNQDALYTDTKGYLVEGVMDAETVGDNCVASLGWKLSNHQVSLISNSRWKELHIIPDRGFENQAMATALFFIGKMDVYIHSLPAGAKDVNDCGFENVIFNNKI